MNVLCLCRSVLHIIAWHSYCSLHGHARFPTDFRYCLILLSSKRYSDSRFQLQRQQVSELNFTLYCFFSSYYYHLKRARDWLQIDNNHSSLDQLHEVWPAYRNIRYFPKSNSILNVCILHRGEVCASESFIVNIFVSEKKIKQKN